MSSIQTNLPSYYTRLGPFESVFLTGRPILMYHHVGHRPRGVRLKGLYMSERMFSRQIRELKAAGFITPPYDTVASCGPNTARHVYLTFDDGFCDVVRNAAAVLHQNGFRAMMFLVADLLGGTNQWQQRQGDAPAPLASVAQVQEWLAAGNEIGSHTLTHPRLTALPVELAREEIGASKKKLEDMFGRPIQHFCYPYGDWNERVRDLVAEAGYMTACTTDFGVNDASAHPLALRRITARYKSRSIRELKRWLARRWKAFLWDV